MNSQQGFQWKGQVRFHQADPAGWMFYGAIFQITHDCLEDFISFLDIPRADWFAHPRWAVPVRASRADYRVPLRVGDQFEIRVSLTQLGDSSLTLKYQICRGALLCAEVETTHVFIDTQTQRKCEIPAPFRTRLEAHLETPA